MDNQYLYLSSFSNEIVTSHSDFVVQFPNVVTIKPHSQIRLISARINPIDSRVEISDTNDIMYIGCDFWNKLQANIPLVPVKLLRGTYSLTTDATNDSFTTMLQNQINEALSSYCLVRGGCTVTINGNQELTIKISSMELYGCPTSPLTDSVYKGLWGKKGIFEAVEKRMFYDDEDDKLFVFASVIPTDASTNLVIKGDVDSSCNGVIINNDATGYWISPPVVTGLTGGTEGAKHLSGVIDIDLRTASGNPLENDDYIQIWHGACDEQGFIDSDQLTSWGYGYIAGEDDVHFNPLHRFAIQFDEDTIILSYTHFDTNKEEQVAYVIKITNQNTNKIYKVQHLEWEDDDFSYYDVELWESSDNGATFTKNTAMSIEGVYVSLKTQYEQLTTGSVQSNKYTSHQNRYGFVFDGLRDTAQRVKMSCAADSDNHGYNLSKASFTKHVSLGSDVNRPITALTDITYEDGDVGLRLTDTQMLLMQNQTPQSDYNIFRKNYDVVEEYVPTTDILSLDADTDTGILIESDSYSKGLVATGHVKVNSKDIPQAFLEIRDLPMNNVSGNPLKGQINKFISPIDFSPSETSNRLYTSKVYTEQFLTLNNSSTMSLTSMHVRICNINGVPMALDGHTLVTVEIRDNPQLKMLNQNKLLIQGLVDKLIKLPDQPQKLGGF